jgi:hypothetical protein
MHRGVIVLGGGDSEMNGADVVGVPQAVVG